MLATASGEPSGAETDRGDDHDDRGGRGEPRSRPAPTRDGGNVAPFLLEGGADALLKLGRRGAVVRGAREQRDPLAERGHLLPAAGASAQVLANGSVVRV